MQLRLILAGWLLKLAHRLAPYKDWYRSDFKDYLYSHSHDYRGHWTRAYRQFKLGWRLYEAETDYFARLQGKRFIEAYREREKKELEEKVRYA